MPRILFAIALLSLAVAVAPAQEHPTLNAPTNSVYVGADGKYEAAPDTAVIQFNVSVKEDRPQPAYDHAAKEVDQVRQVLRANGIEPKMANIGFFSIQPVYDWHNGKQNLNGYRVTTDVSLKLKDFAKIGPITQQLSDADVSESLNVHYTLENIDDAKSKAVEDAYRRSRASAEVIAKASGRALGELSYATVDTFDQVRVVAPRAMMAEAKMAQGAPAPTAEFSPQNVTVTAHVNALYSLK